MTQYTKEQCKGLNWGHKEGHYPVAQCNQEATNGGSCEYHAAKVIQEEVTARITQSVSVHDDDIE